MSAGPNSPPSPHDQEGSGAFVRVSTTDGRQRLPDLIQRTYGEKTVFVFHRYGRDLAALVPLSALTPPSPASVALIAEAARLPDSLSVSQDAKSPLVPVPWRGDREAIARLIDPKGWVRFERAKAVNNWQDWPKCEKRWVSASLAKADAILGLRLEGLESAQSLPCGDPEPQQLRPAGEGETSAALIECVARAINASDGFNATPWEGRTDGWRAAYSRMAEAAIAALSASPASPSWLPIESAPRDGTRFLTVIDDEVRVVAWGKTSHVPIYGFCLADQGVEDFDICTISVWMPLPPPPLSAKDSGEGLGSSVARDALPDGRPEAQCQSEGEG